MFWFGALAAQPHTTTRTKCSLLCLPASLTYCCSEEKIYKCVWNHRNNNRRIPSVCFCMWVKSEVLNAHNYFCVLWQTTCLSVCVCVCFLRRHARALNGCLEESVNGFVEFCFRGTNTIWGHLGRWSLWGNALWPFFKTAAVDGWMRALESWLELASANNVNSAGRRTFNSWLLGED